MDRVQNIKGLPDHDENFSLYSISETVPMMSLGTLEVYTNPLAITIGWAKYTKQRLWPHGGSGRMPNDIQKRKGATNRNFCFATDWR